MIHTRFTLITGLSLAVSLAPVSAGAQAEPGARFLTETLASCRDRIPKLSIKDRKGLDRVLVIDAAGRILEPFDSLPTEREELGVAVFGPTAGLHQVLVRRTSSVADPDAVRILGGEKLASQEGQESLQAQDTVKCHTRLFRVGQFASPEGKVEVSILTEETLPTKIREVSFPVRGHYQGAVSFGPFVTRLSSRDYRSVPRLDAPTDSVLAVAGGDTDLQYALGYTHFFKPGVRDAGLRLGAYLGLPIEDFAKNVLVGLSIDLGGGLVLIHAAFHAGKRNRLLAPGTDEPLEDGDPTDGLTLSVAEEWKVRPAFGLTLDAESAVVAFGKVVGSALGGS